MTPRFVPLLGLSIAAALASAASADVMNITSLPGGSTENLGAFTGTINYTSTGATTGTLAISLTNTSEFAGGQITGLAFQIPSADPTAMAVLSSASVTHPLFLSTGPVNGEPYGDFDAGAALGGDWLGGGAPVGGIGIGQTGTFEFTVTAPDAGSRSTSNFITSGSPFSFLVRFRGFDNEGSDKVPGVEALVPAPGSIALLGCAGVVAARRRRSP